MLSVRCSGSVIHALCLIRRSKYALVGSVVAAMVLPPPAIALDMTEEPLTRQMLSTDSTEAQSREGFSHSSEPGQPARVSTGARYRFGYGLLIAHDQAREDLLIPLRWRGPGVGLRLEWERAAAISRHSVTALIPASFYENRFGHEGYGLGLELAYSYVREIREEFHSGRLFLGGQAKWDVHHGYYESWDEEHIYWIGAYSLGPRLTWDAPRGEKTRLAVGLDFPLIALVSRPPLHRLNMTDPRTKPSFYFTSPQRNLAFAGPFEYTAVHGGMSLARRWGKSSIAFIYDLELVTYDEPERVVTLSNRFSIVRTAW